MFNQSRASERKHSMDHNYYYYYGTRGCGKSFYHFDHIICRLIVMFFSHVLFFVAGVECDDILIFIWYIEGQKFISLLFIKCYSL